MLTFLVAFVMYMDRTCIGVAAPTLMREFQMNKIRWGWAARRPSTRATLSFRSPPDGWLIATGRA